MSLDDVILSKGAIIERCVRRIREEHAANPELDCFTHQDALILNVERACQACIDIAMHLCSVHHLGMPQSSANAFDLLARAGRIDGDLAKRLIRMTGFRNRAVHLYQELDLTVVRAVAGSHHADFLTFAAALGLNLKP